MHRRLKELLQKGEDESLDYKQTISSARKIAKTMCSFANSKGGILLVGVRDNKSIAGVRTEDEKYMLELAAAFHVKPEIPIAVKEYIVDGKIVLQCNVAEGDKKPYYARTDDDKWMVYVRVKDRSLQASKIVVDVMKRMGSERGTLIKYSRHEEALLKYLQTHDKITLMEFKQLVNISKRSASRILVNLISAGIILNHTSEKTEFYTLT